MRAINLLFFNHLKHTNPEDSSYQLHKKEYVEFIIQDISNLLNSKQTYARCSDTSSLKGFIFDYGLDELKFYSPYSQEDHKKVASLIKEAINLFEPRLNDVSVIPIRSLDDENIFCFQILAMLEFADENMTIILESKINALTKEVNLTLSS